MESIVPCFLHQPHLVAHAVFATHVLASNIPVPFTSSFAPPIADHGNGVMSSHNMPHACLMAL
jgi:hypothetical protein